MKTRFISFIFVLAACLAVAFPATALAANNVHNVTQNKWYDTLSAATAAAADGNVIEVHNSFNEITSVKIQKQNLTIRAAAGKNPTISWTQTDSVPVTGATSYHCVVVYTSVTTSTTFGGGTGTLTFDATKASSINHKGKRARVMMHCGSGALNIKDGVVLTGGNTGGGNYDSNKDGGRWPEGSGEVTGVVNFGSGLYMYKGTLNMTGGVIRDNYSLFARTNNGADNVNANSHNFVGGGGGVYLNAGTVMNMSGGVITHNAAGSGGGAGILVGASSKLTVSGGTISENVCRFASGGGIGVQTGAEVKVAGGLIKENVVEGHGGGLFARGDSIPLEITGGTFEGNVAGSYGGGVLFWTVGDDVVKNTVVIGGDAKIINNKAEFGGGVSVGREVRDGIPYGNKAKLVIQGSPEISGNTAVKYGGGIHMQSDEFSAAVNTVEISGGMISGNKAEDGAGIYVPGGTVTMTGGSFVENKASNRGAGIFTGGGAMTISNANFSKNEASGFGGGAYVVGGSVLLNSGTFSENKAKSGGAFYITKVATTGASNLTMNAGTFSKNAAVNTGGAVYIEGGNVEIRHGDFVDNSATFGGAVYMAGDASTSLIMESGTMSGNTASDDGGAVYATGGNLYIGLLGCAGKDNDMHVAKGDGRHHPQITGNDAGDTGGGIAVGGAGSVYLYCGDVVDNDALYKGVGFNVFMNGGKVYLHEGANVGTYIDSKLDPDLVIVGGQLIDGSNAEGGFVTLKYYQSNTAASTDKVGYAEADMRMNLPDGIYFFNAPMDGYMFFGWTPKGAVSAQKFVRDDEEYLPSGTAVTVSDVKAIGEAQGTYDDSSDGIMNLYALWAPSKSKITYAGYVTEDGFASFSLEQQTVNPAEYAFAYDSSVVSIADPGYAGYELVGWYVYQNESQNANWGKEYEPVYLDGEKNYSNLDFSKMKYIAVSNADDSFDLEMGKSRFGDITLIAKYEPIYGTVTISKAFPQGASYSVDANQPFVFRITGVADDKALPAIDMDVVVYAGSSVAVTLPAGDYKVAEDLSWAWRYACTSSIQSADLDVQDESLLLEFVNKQESVKWLNFFGSKLNVFTR